MGFLVFFKSYLNSFVFIIMMFSMLLHAKIGCETIIQDYISKPRLKIFLKNFITFINLFSLLLVIVAIVRLNII